MAGRLGCVDIQDLFRSSGLGTRAAFALMSQGSWSTRCLRPATPRTTPRQSRKVGGVPAASPPNGGVTVVVVSERRSICLKHACCGDELAPRLKGLERAARRAREID